MRLTRGACDLRFAADLGAALEELERGRFDVLVCFSDLAPPGSALEVVVTVAQRWPDMRLLLLREDLTHHAAPMADTYTCTMHPQVVKNAPGKCPICGMNLVKKESATPEKAAP